MAERRLRGEFQLISELFAPLAANAWGALGLGDDACLVRPDPGFHLVVTADALIAGVHFLRDDPPETVGRKLLRVNLSDLAAMGAHPIGYVLTVILGAEHRGEWMDAFVAGAAGGPRGIWARFAPVVTQSRRPVHLRSASPLSDKRGKTQCCGETALELATAFTFPGPSATAVSGFWHYAMSYLISTRRTATPS